MANFLKAEEMSAKESTTESQILNQLQDYQSGRTQLSKNGLKKLILDFF
jgi:hypothetical protein